MSSRGSPHESSRVREREARPSLCETVRWTAPHVELLGDGAHDGRVEHAAAHAAPQGRIGLHLDLARLAKLDESPLREPRMQLDLVDGRSHATVREQIEQIVFVVVRDAYTSALALVHQTLHRLPGRLPASSHLSLELSRECVVVCARARTQNDTVAPPWGKTHTRNFPLSFVCAAGARAQRLATSDGEMDQVEIEVARPQIRERLGQRTAHVGRRAPVVPELTCAVPRSSESESLRSKKETRTAESVSIVRSRETAPTKHMFPRRRRACS